MSGFNTVDEVIQAVTRFGAGSALYWNKQNSGVTHVLFGHYDGSQFAGSPGPITYAGALATPQNVQGLPSPTHSGLLFPAAPVGETRHLTRLIGSGLSTSSTGILQLVDLLQYINYDLSTNAIQNTIGPLALPRYSDGRGVQMALAVTNAAGIAAGAAITGTITYTNQDGTAGRVATFSAIRPSTVTRFCHTFDYIPLQGSDSGVRSVQSFQFSIGAGALTTGSLLLFRPISQVSVPSTSAPGEENALVSGKMEQIVDGACLTIFHVSSLAVVSPTFSATVETVTG